MSKSRSITRRRVLVCGASGFIGRHIVESLCQDPSYEVIAVYHTTSIDFPSQVQTVQSDLRDPRQIDSLLSGVDIVIQAAATTSGANVIAKRPYHHVTDNAVMNSYLFRAAFEKNVQHVIFFSCTVMYQSNPQPQSESDFNASEELYPNYFGVGWTKVYLEKMCEFYSRIGETKFTAIRHSNIYGPHDKFDPAKAHVFAATINKVMHATDRVQVWGDGSEARDLLYIDDLVDFVRRAIDRQTTPYELVNVGAGQAITIADLVQTIIRASGRQLSIEYDATKPTFKTTVCLDCSKAKQLFDWQPTTTLLSGIEKTLAWYQHQMMPPAQSPASYNQEARQ